MGNTPSTNASSTTAMTPEVGAGTSVLASTDDGDESICSGSNGKKPKLQQPFIPLEPGNPSGNAVFPANASVAMTYSGHYTYQHPTHAPRDITYPSKLRSSTTTADYYYPPSSFATTLSSSVSSVSSNSSTSSSLSSYSQGSPSPPHTHAKRSSRSVQGLHNTSNLPLQSNSPTNSSSSSTSSGTVTPLQHSPLVSGSDPKKSPGTNKLHQQALLSSTSTLLSKPANIAPVHSSSSMTLNSSGRRNESKSNPSSASKNHPHIQQQPTPSLKKADPPKKQHAVDINELIQRLLDAGVSSYSSKASRKLCITNNEIIGICRAARPIFLAQPTLLELGTPVQVVGDIHGQYGDLMRVFQTCGMPPHSNYLFLGDYVDRGKQSIETILLLLCFKIRYPENVFLLRGNHESASVTKVYGFYDECKRRASVKVWKSFVDTFNTFPIAATIGGKIFCVHGGLSPYLNSLDDIRNIHRPTDIPDVGLLSDMLWSDPDASVAEWSPNDRGISYCFGSSVVDAFCSRFNFDLIARGHMVVEDGYEFFDRRKLVTVFSAPNYCGEFGNWAAVMSVGKDLLCRFELLKPLDINGVRKALKENKFVGSINSTRATNLRHKG